MLTRIRRRIVAWRERLRQPVDPFHESAPGWAQRKTALAITSAPFVLAEFVASPLMALLVTPAAGALTALALVGLTFLGSLLIAPVSQRNMLREQVHGRPGDLQFTAQLEFVRWKFELPLPPADRIFDVHVRAAAWLWVKNNGPTATFAAEIREVTGVPSDWGDYWVAEAAWDQKNAPTVEIPHGARRKLKVAAIAEYPQRGFWFWIADGQEEVPGMQWWLGDDESGTVAFEISITNTATDQVNTTRGSIRVPARSAISDSSFDLVEADSPGGSAER